MELSKTRVNFLSGFESFLEILLEKVKISRFKV